MSRPVRILVVIPCALALWCLVIRLARGVDKETGGLPEGGSTRVAVVVGPPGT